jgi:hypothetical protein
MGMRWAGHVDLAHVGEMSNMHRILVGKSEGRRPLGRLSHRRDDNNKIDAKIGCEVVGWIHLAQERSQRHILTNMIINVEV